MRKISSPHLKFYLASDDYNLYEAYDGREAIEIIEKNDIHLIPAGYHDAGYGWHAGA